MPLSITLTDTDAEEYIAWRFGVVAPSDAPTPTVAAIANGTEPAKRRGRPPKATAEPALATVQPPPGQVFTQSSPTVTAPAPVQQTIEQVEAQEKAERAKRERVAVTPTAAGPALPAIEREDYRAWCRDAAMKLGGGAAAVAAIKEIHGGRTIDQLQPAEFQPARIRIEALLGERGAVAVAQPPGL